MVLLVDGIHDLGGMQGVASARYLPLIPPRGRFPSPSELVRVLTVR